MIFAAAVVGGVTLAIIKIAQGPPTGRLGARDYTRDLCGDVPRRQSLVQVRGFRPLAHGQVALQTTRESESTPAVIYIWGASGRCTATYGLEGGP